LLFQQRIKCISITLNAISYGLYFDINGDDNKEHVGDFDAFFPGHTQYLAFSLDGEEGYLAAKSITAFDRF